MPTKFLLLSFCIFFTSEIFAQVQVSNIVDLHKTDHYSKKGFLSLGEEHYFIQQGEEGTLVSMVKEDALELLHNIEMRPTNEPLNFNAYSYANSNSGLIYEDEYLYEIYSNYIYVINILTGELDELIDLRSEGFRIQSNFLLGESYMFFSAYDDDGTFNVRYDRMAKIFERIPDFELQVNEDFYSVINNGSELFHYSLVENVEEVLPSIFSNIQSIFKLIVSNNETLIVKDDNGMTLIDQGAVVRQIDCQIPNTLTILSILNNKIVCTDLAEDTINLITFDLNSCVVESNLAYFDNLGRDRFRNYKLKELEDNYLLFGFSNNWQGIGITYLYNIDTGELNDLELPIDYILTDRAARYGDQLYLITRDETHFEGTYSGLIEIDLENLTSPKLSGYEMPRFYDLVLGENQDDGELYFYQNSSNKSALTVINTIDNKFNDIQGFNYLANFGIRNSVHADVWSHDKYFFTTGESIYVLENNIVSKILDVGPNTHTTSSILAHEDYVYVLSGFEAGYFVLKINVFDLSYTQQYIPDLDYIHFSKIKTNNAIVNLKGGNLPGYYNVFTQKYYAFSEFGFSDANGFVVSGDNIIVKNYSDSDEWGIINMVTNESVIAEIEPGTYPDPYPDGVGGFYCTGWQFSDEVNFFHIDGQGKYREIVPDFDYPVFYDGNKIYGETKSLAFDHEDHMLIYSSQGSEQEFKIIPDAGIEYWGDFFWYESDDRSFLEISNGVNNDTYTFAFGVEPVIIRPSKEDQLIIVIEEEDKSVMIYKDAHDLITFYDYNYGTGDFIERQSFQAAINYSYTKSVINLGPSEYLLVLNDGIHGLEPWRYNSDTGELSLKKNINEKFTSSNPSDFTVSPNADVYFSAITKTRDRQLFNLAEVVFIDEDNDGFPSNVDCDDQDATISPNAVEIVYNGIDDDCNPNTFDDDLDGDGFNLMDDCDDTDSSIFPSALEIPYNGIDDDCDEDTLDDDLDQDGFPLSEDCDDTSYSINPEAIDIPGNDLDENCDGIDGTVAIFEVGDIKVEVFPNPARNVIHVLVGDGYHLSIDLYSAQGKKIFVNYVEGVIDVRYVPNGIYILKMTNNAQGISISDQIIINGK